MLVLCGLISLGGIGAAVRAVMSGSAVPSWAAAAVIGLGVPPVAAAVLIRWIYWQQITNSVPVTDRQLPQLHAMHVDLVARMGLDHIPRLYVVNGNGTLNAWASKCRVRRGYVVLSSDLIDIAHELGDVATIRFVLAHELGHIKCGHVSLWRTGLTALPRILRLDKSLTRAQEYTADRTAAYFAPEGARGLLVLYAGKRLYRHIDFDVYRASVGDHRDGIWMRLVNLWADHPVGFRRMAALANVTRDQKGWDVHGRML